MNRRSWPWMLVAVALALSAMVSFAAADNIVSRPGGTYENIATHDVTDANGAQYVTDVSRDRDYSQQIPCITAISCAAKSKVYQAYPVDIHEYSKVTVEVSWTYATADTGKLDSLMLEVIPYVKQSQTVDGYDFSVDLDPSTPLVNGVYITREATPLPVYGYGLASGIKFVVPTVTGEFPLTAYTNTALPSYVTSANAGQVWLRADTTGNADSLISNGTHLLSAGSRTVMLSAPARSLAGGMQTCSLYLDPPIKVFANARWYSMVTSGLSAYDNMNTVSFPLTMKNGAPVTGNYLGFIVVNHSPTVHVYVSVDIWPRVN